MVDDVILETRISANVGCGNPLVSTVMLAQLLWPSTVAHPVPDDELVDVNVEAAWPVAIVPLVGLIVPLAADHVTGIFGTTFGGEFPRAAPSELCVMSSVTAEEPKVTIVLGDALTLCTIHGSVVAVPVTPLVVPVQPIPVAPGP